MHADRSAYDNVVCIQLDKPHDNGVLTAYIKGAPERVLAKCSTYLKDGQTFPITDDFRKAYDDAYNVSIFLPIWRRNRPY